MALVGEMHYLTIGDNTYSIPVSGGGGGTVTSVRVQATSPVQSSTSTEQTTSLNTTISLADAYGDTKNPYGSKTKNYVLAAPSNAAGNPSFRALVAADIPDLSGTYLTSHQSIKTLHSKTLTGTGDVTLTYSDVGAAQSSHAHGNITSGGDITATAPTIANGDQLIINDSSASKITNGPTFDGSTTTKALTPKGTWETFAKSSDIPTVPTNISAFTNDVGYLTSGDVPEGASAYTGTISAVGTSASAGSNNGFARGDHVHNITGTTITSALGYTPYNSTNPNGYVTTDENLKWTASTSSNTYYPLVSTSTATTSTANSLNGINFYQYYNTAGGYRRLNLGNSTAYKSTGGAYGTIRLYGAAATYYGDLVPGVLGTTSGDGHISANRTWTLPDKTGTIALISDIPTISYPVTSVNTKTGAVSLTASDVGALPSTTVIPTITLNGSSTTSPSFYAPTGAGTSGQYLKSNGSGAPSWTNFPTIPSITLNGSSTTSPSFYAPTSAGTSGYILTSSGSGAPGWTSGSLTDIKLQVAEATDNTTYYPIFGTGTSAATRQYDTTGITYTTRGGTANDILTNPGQALLTLGNSLGTLQTGWKQGRLELYSSFGYKTTVVTGNSNGDNIVFFPQATGTIALTSDITDTHVSMTQRTSSSGKAYLLATTTEPSSTAQSVVAVAGGVYFRPTGGNQLVIAGENGPGDTVPRLYCDLLSSGTSISTSWFGYGSSSGNFGIYISDETKWLIYYAPSTTLPLSVSQFEFHAPEVKENTTNKYLSKSAQCVEFVATTGTTKTLTVPNNSAGFIIASAANNNNQNIYIYNVSSTGAVTLKAMGTASNIVTGTSTNAITLKGNSYATRYMALVFYGDLPTVA